MAKGKHYKIMLPQGMGDPLYTGSFMAALEMAKYYGKGTRVIDLRKRKNPVPGSDPDSVRELDLYADNTFELYNQFTSIIENIKRRLAKGQYDPLKAPKLWEYWYDAAAKRYKKEFGHYFPPAVRRQAAAERAVSEYHKIIAGEYGELPVFKTRKSKKLSEYRKNSSGKGAAAGFKMFHQGNPEAALKVKVPAGFPRRMYALGKLHKLVLTDGRVLRGGYVAASGGNRMYLLGVKGDCVKSARVKQIEYDPPRTSAKAGAVYFHPFKRPPLLRGKGRGFYTLAGKGVKLTPRGIVG